MTYVYGVTRRTLCHYIATVIHEDDLPEGIRLYQVADFLGALMIQAIEQTVPAAAEAMRWLRKVAGESVGEHTLVWRSPAGMPVIQAYPKLEYRRVDVRACGCTKLIIREASDKLNAHEMRNGISPNFVHSLDASHLMLTANAMQDAGLQMFAIHDSFGTHPCDVAQMQQLLRQAFVGIYKDKNVLFDFLWACGGTGEVPKQGSLDIEEVLKSEFFFS